MKVQLQRQSMRLRVDEEELAALLAGDSLENLTRFGGTGGWGTALSLHGGDQAVLLDGGTYCRLVLPREAVQGLAAGTPGLQFPLYLDDGTTLQLHVAVGGQ